MPLALREVVDRPWQGRLAAYYVYSSVRTDETWDRWLDVVASPLWVDRHNGEVHLRFEIPPPRDLPARPLWWQIQLENPPDTQPVFEFRVPREVAFPEEF